MTLHAQAMRDERSSATRPIRARRGVILLAAVLAGVLLQVGPATAGPVTVVSVAGAVTSSAGIVHLGVNARGPADALSGRGGSSHVTTRGVPATFRLSGEVAADVVTLRGHVVNSPLDFLVGTPVEIVADDSSGTITLRFGPISGGPFDGITLRFSGVGHVHVT